MSSSVDQAAATVEVETTATIPARAASSSSSSTAAQVSEQVSIIAEPEQQEHQTLQLAHVETNPHVIAFVNHGSGSGKGAELTRMLTKAIGEGNIYRLGGPNGNPKTIISQVHETHPSFRIIVCGGDGSVNWVLSVIADLGYDDIAVGIVPNGTGNDTSRYLGWGHCQFDSKTTQANIDKMCAIDTPTRPFDRWQLFMSFRKDEMLERTMRLMKTGEVPATHTMTLVEPAPPNNTKETTSSLMKKSNDKQQLQDSTGDGTSSTSLSADSPMETYYFPRYFSCMLRLDELQFLERYKWLHSVHQPQSFTALSPSERRQSQIRFSQPGFDKDGKVVVGSNGDGVIDGDVQRRKFAQTLENASKWFRFTWSFNNYFSFGIDAQVMNYFGIHRDNNPGCYMCRCCNLGWIATCSTITCVKCQKKQLRYRIDVLYKEGDLTPIDAVPSPNKLPHPTQALSPMPAMDKRGRPIVDKKKPTPTTEQEEIDIAIYTTEPTLEESTTGLASWAGQDELPFLDNPQHLANDFKWLSATFDPLSHDALVLLNIPSYAGGRNIWGTKSQMSKKNERYLVEEFEQETDDGRLELAAFTGFQQMQFTVMTQSATYRLGQIKGLRIYMEMDGYVQLDGEAWIQPQGVIEIFRSKEGKMLFNDNPHYPCC